MALEFFSKPTLPVALKEAESHQEYMLKVLREELAYREAKRKNRLIKQTGFYTLKTFEGYYFDEIGLPAELSVADFKEAITLRLMDFSYFQL